MSIITEYVLYTVMFSVFSGLLNGCVCRYFVTTYYWLAPHKLRAAMICELYLTHLLFLFSPVKTSWKILNFTCSLWKARHPLYISSVSTLTESDRFPYNNRLRVYSSGCGQRQIGNAPPAGLAGGDRSIGRQRISDASANVAPRGNVMNVPQNSKRADVAREMENVLARGEFRGKWSL